MMYIHQVLIAFDQLINTLLGGWADETLSSRLWRNRANGLYKIVDTILFFDKDHCHVSYISERLRLQQPPELRDDNDNN